MQRALYLLVAVAGVAVVVGRKRFVKASAQTSQTVFGRDVREGSREARFQSGFTRILALVVGGALMVMGLLGVFGVIWKE